MKYDLEGSQLRLLYLNPSLVVPPFPRRLFLSSPTRPSLAHLHACVTVTLSSPASTVSMAVHFSQPPSHTFMFGTAEYDDEAMNQNEAQSSRVSGRARAAARACSARCTTRAAWMRPASHADAPSPRGTPLVYVCQCWAAVQAATHLSQSCVEGNLALLAVRRPVQQEQVLAGSLTCLQLPLQSATGLESLMMRNPLPSAKSVPREFSEICSAAGGACAQLKSQLSDHR